MKIYEDKLIYIEVHESQIPWLKIFTQTPYKELSETDEKTRERLFAAAFLIEREMLSYFKPEKINWASFGNMLPRVHIHIQARFKGDEYFPEPVWGTKQREGDVLLPPIEAFLKTLAQKMQECFDKN
jgi:diadenosine tetraphosphate (Ap4A) HIT family hydrolase